MLAKVRSYFFSLQDRFLQIDNNEKKKLVLLAFTFFFIIGSYSILRSLKTSIFLGLVGKEYKPYTRFLTLGFLVPSMILHSTIVDRLKRHQTLYFFLGLYGIICFIFAGLLAHPVYGLANTQVSKYRLLGWAFDLFMDLYPSLIVSTFWGFVNSVSTPHFASNGYGTIIAISRFGGIIMPFVGFFILTQSSNTPAQSIPFLIILAALSMFIAALCIYRITQVVPPAYLHGYSTSNESLEKASPRKPKNKIGVLEGLRLMLMEPYVFGIFILVCSFEAINVIFDYQMNILISIDMNNDVKKMSLFMFMYTATFQTLSLASALLGTNSLLKKIGIKRALMVLPAAIICLILALGIYPKLSTIFIAMVIIRGLNYGFNHPIREMLYVPTVSNIQFKSKAWIESFGRTFSKNAGNMINIATNNLEPYIALLGQSGITLSIALVWLATAIKVGARYEETMKKGIIIGREENNS